MRRFWIGSEQAYLSLMRKETSIRSIGRHSACSDSPVVTHVNQLSVIDRTVSRTILALKSGEKQQLSFSTERGVSNLSVDASEMIVRDTPLRIIAMNDVHEELDEKENEYAALDCILTHEIMNSVAPITSISDSLLSEKELIPASARKGSR